MIAALLALSLSVAAAPDEAGADVTLRLEIAKNGDLRWKNQPCTATVLLKDGTTNEFGDAAEFVVAKGPVEAIIACAAS